MARPLFGNGILQPQANANVRIHTANETLDAARLLCICQGYICVIADITNASGQAPNLVKARVYGTNDPGDPQLPPNAAVGRIVTATDHNVEFDQVFNAVVESATNANNWLIVEATWTDGSPPQKFKVPFLGVCSNTTECNT